jgi:hypothetical protein
MLNNGGLCATFHVPAAQTTQFQGVKEDVRRTMEK